MWKHLRESVDLSLLAQNGKKKRKNEKKEKKKDETKKKKEEKKERKEEHRENEVAADQHLLSKCSALLLP